MKKIIALLWLTALILLFLWFRTGNSSYLTLSLLPPDEAIRSTQVIGDQVSYVQYNLVLNDELRWNERTLNWIFAKKGLTKKHIRLRSNKEPHPGLHFGG